MEVPDIVTPRLRLVSLSSGFIEATLAGSRAHAEEIGGFQLRADWPDEHDRRWLEFRLGQMRQQPSWREWLIRAILPASDDTMLGHINFHGPPEDGVAELGYTVFPEHRRKGYAIEAAEAMFSWAGRTHGVRRFRLSISPANEPSLAMAAKMSFVRVGEQMDEEDGLEYVFERSS